MVRMNKNKRYGFSKNNGRVKTVLCFFVVFLLVLTSFSTMAYAYNDKKIIIEDENKYLQSQNNQNVDDNKLDVVDLDKNNEDINDNKIFSSISQIKNNKFRDSTNIFSKSGFSIKNLFYNLLKRFLDSFPRLYNISFLVKLLERFNDSSNDNSSVDTSPPSRVSDLIVSPQGSGKILLSWSPAEDDNGVEKYNVYQDDSLSASVVTTSYMISGLEDNQVYSYQVSAVDSSGNEGETSDSEDAVPSDNDSEQNSNMLPETGHISILSEGEMMLDTSLNINNEFLVTLQGNLFMDTNMESLDIWWNLSSGYFEINASVSSSGEDQHFRLENFLIEIEEIGSGDYSKLSFSIGYISIDASGHIVIFENGDKGSLALGGMLSFDDIEVSATNFLYDDFTLSGSVDLSVAFTGDFCISWNESGISIPGDDPEFGAGVYVSVEDLFFENSDYEKITVNQIIISAGGYFFIGDTIEAEFAGGFYIDSLTVIGSTSALIGSLSLTGMGFVSLSNDDLLIEASAGLSVSGLFYDSGGLTLSLGSLMLSGEVLIQTKFDLSNPQVPDSFQICASGGGEASSISFSGMGIDLSLSSFSAGANANIDMGRDIDIGASGYLDLLGLHAEMSGLSASVGGLHASGGVSLSIGSVIDVGFSAGLSIVSLYVSTGGIVANVGFISFGGDGYASLGSNIQLGVSGSLVVDNVYVSSAGFSATVSYLVLSASYASVDIDGSSIVFDGTSLSIREVSAQIGGASISCGLLSVSGSASVTLGPGLSIDSAGGSIGSVVVENLFIQGLSTGLFSINSVTASVSLGLDFIVYDNGLLIDAAAGAEISNLDVDVYLQGKTHNIRADHISITSSILVSFSDSTLTIDSYGTSISAEGLFVPFLGEIGSISFEMTGKISIKSGNPLGIGFAGLVDLSILGIDISLEGDAELWIYDLSALLAGDLSNIHITGDVNSFTEFSIKLNENIISAEFETGQVELIADLSNLDIASLLGGDLPPSGSLYVYTKGTNIATFSGLEYIIGVPLKVLGDSDLTLDWDISDQQNGYFYFNGYVEVSVSISGKNRDFFIDVEQFSGFIDVSWDINSYHDGNISFNGQNNIQGKITLDGPKRGLKIIGEALCSGTISWDFSDGLVTLLSAFSDFIYNGDLLVKVKTKDDDWIKVWPILGGVSGDGPYAYFEWYPPVPQVGEPVTFDASLSEGDNLEYNWDFDDDDDDDSSPQPSTQSSSSEWYDSPIIEHVFESGGTYLVTLTVREKDSGETDSISMYVDLDNQLPVASFTMILDPIENHVRENEDIRFDASSSYDPDGEIVNYKWDFNNDGTFDITGSDKTIVYHNYSDEGDYTARLTVTDNDGKSDSVSISFHIYHQDPANSEPEVYIHVMQRIPPDGLWSVGFGYTGCNNVISLEGSTECEYKFLSYRPIGVSGGNTHDGDGYIRKYKWDWQTCDGSESTGWIDIDEDDQIPNKGPFTWSTPGTYSITLSVEDEEHAVSSSTVNMNILLSEGEFMLLNPSVEPMNIADSQVDSTTITYSVEYIDGDGDIPISCGIVINGNGPFSLSDDGQPVTEGRTYYKNVDADWQILDESNSFYFTFTNGPDGTKTTDTIDGPFIGPTPPVASIIAPSTGETNVNIEFSASFSNDPDGTIESYYWDFGNGETSTLETYTIYYELPGQYTVTLTVTDNDGLTDTDTHIITISSGEDEPTVRTLPAGNVDGDSAALRGYLVLDGSDDCTVRFKYKKQTAIFWTTRTLSGTYSTGDYFNYELSGLKDETTYVFKAIAENDYGTDEGETLSFYTDSSSPPPEIDVTLSYTPTEDININDNVQFTATVSGGTLPYTWDWIYGDGATDTYSSSDTTQVKIHKYISAGDFTVTLIVTDDEGNSGETSANVHVSGSTPPVAITDGPYYGNPGAGGGINFYGGDSYDPDANAGAPFDGITWFRWEFETSYGVDVSEGADSTGGYKEYFEAGDYYVKLTVTDGDDLTHTTTTTAHIGTISAPVSNPSCSPSEVAVGETIHFDGSSSYDSDGNIVLYKWEFTDGYSTKYTEDVDRVCNTPGIYRAYLTVEDNDGLIDIDYCVFHVVEDTNDPPNAVISGPDTIQKGHEATYSALGSFDSDGSIVQYDWYGRKSGEYLIKWHDNVGESFTVKYATAGSKTIKLRVHDNDGAIDAVIKIVDVSSGSNPSPC